MAMKTKVNDEKAKRDYGKQPDTDFIRKSKQQLKQDNNEVLVKWNKVATQDRKTQEICGRVLASFGEHTLRKALKMKGFILSGDETELRTKMTIETKQELVARLDPFV